ncbi:MAG: acyloxyacyl hydrolase [Pseudomonadota bacterium]
MGTDESAYGYAGFGLEFVIDEQFVITPSTAIGAYHRGEGRRLGSTLEFRSGLELAYRWDNDIQLGLGYHHLSNADIGDNNPGTEHLSLYLNIPLDGSVF